MIDLSIVLLIIGISSFHASDQQRDMYRLTYDPIFLENSSKILFQFQIQALIILLIIYVISSIFDMIFKYQRNRLKHLLFLIVLAFLTIAVAAIFSTMTEHKLIRDTASIIFGIYFSVISLIGYYVIPIIHKDEKEEKESINLKEASKDLSFKA
jgi:hypothetical protein